MMSMKRIAQTLVIGAAAAIAAACGGAAQKQPAAEPEAPAEETAPQSQQPGYGQQPPAGAAGAPVPGEAAPNAFPGSTRHGEQESDEAAVEKRSERSVQDLSRDLDRALSLSVPDCSQASVLRDQICDLAESICRLADRNASEQELAQRCGDARSSCERASQRLHHSCP